MSDFKIGDRVRYRSFAGDIFDATVTGLRPSGFLDLDIDVPGNREPFHTTAVPAERCSPVAAQTLQPAADARP